MRMVKAGQVKVCDTIVMGGNEILVTRLQWVSGEGVRFFKGSQELPVIPFADKVQVK